MPTEQDKAAISKKRGVAAAQISDPEKRKAFIAAQGDAEKSGKANYEQLDREAEDTIATQGQNKAVGAPSYKKGGFVKKTGLARVHKGEYVAPRKYAKAASHLVGKRKKTNTPRGKAKVQKTMHEFKTGGLHSGSKRGPVVKSRKQAVAIALSQARKES